MSFARWEGTLLHAKQYLDASKTEGIFDHVRARNAVEAADLSLKALFVKFFPEGRLSGHINRGQLGTINIETGILAPKHVNDAVRFLEKHYNASRYVEDTSNAFCGGVTTQVGCHHYPDIINEIISAAEIIVNWVEEQLRK